MGVVALQRVGHLLERSEAVRDVLGHELADALAAPDLDPRCDIDQHQAPRHVVIGMFTDGGERGDAPE